MNDSRRALIAGLVLVGLVAEVVSAAEPRDGVVTGFIRLQGEPPEPRVWKLDDVMVRATGDSEYREEVWLLGKDKGLANCIVSLKPHAKNGNVELHPTKAAVLKKVGVRYRPRVLVVAAGSEVILTNEKSPCRGFNIHGRRLKNSWNYLIHEGEQRTICLDGSDRCSVTSPVRPYAQGYIVAVDTPYFAVTNADGKFTIDDVPSGKYGVSVWHEAAGVLSKDAGPAEVTVGTAGAGELNYQVAIPIVGNH